MTSDEAQGARTIRVGETATGVISSTDASCSFATVEGGWGGLCNAFFLEIPVNGTLKLNLRSSDNAPLSLFAKTSSGAQVDMACCGSGIGLQVPVAAGGAYRVEVAYCGRPPGYPAIPPVTYALDTSLLTGPAQPKGVVRALMFADASKTQRLAAVRFEVLDGPSAGAVADYDPATGIYEIRDLPSGFVQVSASAKGFVRLVTTVSAGLTVPYEFVLQRSAPVAGTNSLWGIMYAYPSKPGDTSFWAYGGVEAEILDGPLAGAFTFSNDDDNGAYFFRNIPPGPIHVRASMPGLQTETLEVVVSGDTRLDFVMKRQ